LKKLGKYELLGELGHGAMGVVYRARDPIINRLVALKTITTGVANDPSLLQRFYREAQSAGGLQHPNIVTIYDMGEAGDLPYIAMELVEGENLEQVIANRPNLPITLKLVYAMQACRAFDYAHKRGIVHRDIKPGNVMLGKDGTVKVVDFGIARVLEASRTQTGMLIGTFAYMSPEQYHGEHADERSDIWSFGVLLYELLCYERPFKGSTPASLMHSICQETLGPMKKFIEDCPEELELIIVRVLQKNPNDRYQSMEDLLLELDTVCKRLQVQFVADLITQSRELFEQSNFAEARDLLRQALQVESGNQQARSLLERANSEVKRLQNRPNVQRCIDMGKALLEQGKFQEAKSAADSALQVDSTFGPAQELRIAAEKEIEHERFRAETLEAARQRLAEGLPEEAEVFLAKVLQSEPANRQALELQGQVEAEKAERQKRSQLRESLRRARELWTQENYDECIRLLTDLDKTYPGEDEISRLLESARYDQVEQQKQQGLLEFRNLLASGRHEECLALLDSLQKSFPRDEEIPRLLEEARRDQMDRRRLQKLTEARSLLAAGQYEACISLLVSAGAEFPEDVDIPRILETARQSQQEQRRQQGIAEARKHLAARRFEKCLSALAALQQEFPGDVEALKLQEAVRQEQAEERKQQRLQEARKHFAARRFERCLAALAALQQEFPGDAEGLKLQEAVRQEQAEERKQQRLQEARNLLESKEYQSLRILLESLKSEFPGEEEVQELLESALKEQSEQRKREGVAEARKFLAAKRYDETIALLQRLEGDFPAETEIRRLLQSTREDQAEHRKQEGLLEARSLLRANRFADSIVVLEKLQAAYPAETEIRKQLATAREELKEQDKQKKLAEGRNLLAAQSFPEALTLLNALAESFPKDPAVSKLRILAQCERDKYVRAERIQRELDVLKKLMGEKKYTEVVARTKTLLAEFPGETQFTRLAQFATGQQANIERETLFRTILDEAKSHFAASRFGETIRVAETGLKRFPGNMELANLLQQAEGQQRKLEIRQQIEMRIREIRVKINREKFSEAVDLAKETLVTLGPDTDLTQLLNSAQVEIEAREKKRKQERAIETIRTLVDTGNFDEATLAVEDALKTNLVETFDPRIQRLSQEIEDARLRAQQRPTSSPVQPSPQPVLSAEYAFLVAPPVPNKPEPSETQATVEVSSTATSPAPPTVSPQSSISTPPQEMEPPELVTFVEPVAPAPAESAPVVEPAVPVAAESAVIAEPEVPVVAEPPAPIEPAFPTAAAPVLEVSARAEIPAPQFERPAKPLLVEKPPIDHPPQPSPATTAIPILRKPLVLGIAALGLTAVVWLAIRPLSSNKTIEPKEVVNANPEPRKPSLDPLELQQRQALDSANKSIAANDFSGAQQILQAAPSNGPLTPEISRKLSEIDASMKDAHLRQLRQSEEKLWQRALNRMANDNFTEAQKDLRQVLALPSGGVHREDAQNYLDHVLPQRIRQNSLTSQARQALQGGDFRAARQAADQLKQSGADATAVVAEINQLEQARLTQLEAQFAQLKRRDDDPAIQQLKALQPKFQALVGDGGPQSGEASNYVNAVPEAITEMQAGIQKRSQDAAFQRTVQRYQQAASANDKAGLASLRSEFQSLAQGGGSHAGEAQRYRTEIDNKLAALAEPPPVAPAAPPKTDTPARVLVDNDAEVRTVVQRYAQAFEQRDADALKQVWPGMGSKYARYKQIFDLAASIHEQLNVESVAVSPDGTTAVVKSRVSQTYTPKEGKAKPQRFANEFVFNLRKTSQGTWVITDVQ
jgi:serine/threonine protein kinase